MDRFLKKKRSNEPAKPAKSAKRASEEIGWARCPICDATVAISVMGQHVDSGCKEFAGAKRRKSDVAAAPALFAVPHETLGGQYIVADFLSEEEEAEMLAFLDEADADPPWKDCRFNGKHRGKPNLGEICSMEVIKCAIKQWKIHEDGYRDDITCTVIILPAATTLASPGA